MSKSGQHLGWVKKAETFAEWKQYKQAIAAFDKAIKLKPNYVEAWMGKGRALMELEDLDRAIAAFKKVINLEPKNFDAWLMISMAL